MQIQAYHGKTGSEHQSFWDVLHTTHRMISLSISGDGDDPRYAAIWVKMPGPKFKAFHGLKASDFQHYYDTHTGNGFQPSILTGTDSGDDATFAGVFEHIPPVEAKHGLSAAEFIDACNKAQDNNLILKWATVYGGDTFAGVWIPNHSNMPWAYAIDVPADQFQATFDAMVQGWLRAELILPSESGSYLSIWYDDSFSPLFARFGMRNGEYQSEVDTRKKQGLFPIRVQAAGSGNDTVYASICSAALPPATRHWTTTGSSEPNLSAFDDFVKGLMQANGVRAASLAIARDRRLVYARAYNWAESGYPITEPTSVFRIASMTKPITSVAIHQQIEKHNLNYEDSVINKLGLPGGLSLDGRWNAVKVWHLLSHAGGWNDDKVTNGGSGFDPMFSDADVVAHAGALLPATKAQILAYMLVTQNLQFDPGTNCKYSNFGFSLLGLILEKLTEKTYGAAVTDSVFKPLGITRAHLGRSLIANRLPDEVRYHPRFPGVSASVLAPDRPLVPRTYGSYNLENLDSHGGWVMAAADYARFLAAFDLGAANPLLDKTSVSSMWSAPEEPNFKKNFPNVFRGWFRYIFPGFTPAVQHNGELPGTATLGFRRADGLSIVLFLNSDKQPKETPFSLQGDAGLHVEIEGEELNKIANTITKWPTTDLFPTLGLPAFS